jgi:hypothetical protein
MEDSDIFNGHLFHFHTILYILLHFGIFCGHLVYLARFGILCPAKSGNPGWKLKFTYVGKDWFIRTAKMDQFLEKNGRTDRKIPTFAKNESLLRCSCKLG